MDISKHDLEIYVLSKIMANNDIRALTLLITDDFDLPAHKEIYMRLLARSAAGISISFKDVQVDKELGTDASIALATMGGPKVTNQDLDKAVQDITTLSDGVFAVDMLEKIAKYLKKNPMTSADRILSNINSLVTVLSGRHKHDQDIPIGEAVQVALLAALQRQREGNLYFGFSRMDSYMTGVKRGEVVVIGARTNVGKSMLCLHPAYENAKLGKNVLLCLNEMDSENMAIRLLSKMSKTDINAIYGHIPMTSVDEEAIQIAKEEMGGLQLLFKDRVKTVSMIEASLASHQAVGNPVDLVILDHFNRLQTDKKLKQHEGYQEAMHNICDIAKKYNCVFIVMVQVNREGAISAKLSLEHLKGSGAIEEDADKVFLFYGNKDNPSGRIMELAKNRHGKKGALFNLNMKGHIMTFEEESMVEDS